MARRWMITMGLGIAALIFLMTPSGQAEGDPKATIVYLKGHVSVRLPQEEWTLAKKDMALLEQTAVKTGKGSYCDIAIDDSLKNVISLGPETTIIIGGSFRQAQISSGRVFAMMDNLQSGSSFEIKTPVAIAGARGTAWEALVGLEAQFNVASDIIYIKAIDPSGQASAPQFLSEGFSIFVDEKGRMSDIVEMSQADKERLSSWLKDVRGHGAGRGDWQKAIDQYQGQSPNLFEKVLQLDTGNDQKEGEEEEAPETILLPPEGMQTPGIAGEDITRQTYSSEGTVSGGSSGTGQGPGYQTP